MPSNRREFRRPPTPPALTRDPDGGFFPPYRGLKRLVDRQHSVVRLRSRIHPVIRHNHNHPGTAASCAVPRPTEHNPLDPLTRLCSGALPDQNDRVDRCADHGREVPLGNSGLELPLIDHARRCVWTVTYMIIETRSRIRWWGALRTGRSHSSRVVWTTRSHAAASIAPQEEQRVAVRPTVNSVTPRLSIGRDTTARAEVSEVLGSSMAGVSLTRARATTTDMFSLPSLHCKPSLVACFRGRRPTGFEL